jgi:diguanylate cyclase (GGDEF)-like protein/PAS domain S-box-containing protein
MNESIDHAKLIEAMSDGMYVVDQSRTITFWNGSAERITGYDQDNAIGRRCGDGMLNHIDEAGNPMCGTHCPLLATMEDGQTRSTRAYAHHRDGHLVPVRVTAGALRDESGEIVGAVETFTDDSAMKATERRLEETERLAMTDPLTGLGNRRLMEERLEARLRLAPTKGSFAVFFVDLDHFKSINDTHSHATGDDVLSVVGRSLSTMVRTGDDVTRFGGDEYVIITGPMSEGALEAFATRVCIAVSKSWTDAGTSKVHVTASVGATLSRETDTPESIVSRADRALHEAKRSGRDRFFLAPREVGEQADDRCA